MTLEVLIAELKSMPQDAVVPFGFGAPNSYRGIYDDVAFEPVDNARIGDMLAHAKSAVGKTFHGYKGGEYTMGVYTDCWIAEYGDASGDMIGRTLVLTWKWMTGERTA